MQRTLTLLLAAAASAQAGGIYWTNRQATRVERALYDGTGHAPVLTNAGDNVRGVWLDLTNNLLWYCDNGADRINRMNLDGSGWSTVFSIPTPPASFPADIEINPAAGHLYYCDQTRGLLRRTDLSGNNGVNLVTDTTYQPYYLDLDLVNNKIYWGDFDGLTAGTGNVFRMNLDGSGRETVVSGNLETRAVGVDAGAGMLYWVNRNAGKIMRAKISDLPVNATDTVKVQTLYSGLDTPHGMALDIPAGKVYWVDTGTNNTPNTVGDRAVSRGDMDGSGPHEVIINLVPINASSDPWDIEVDPRVATYDEWIARFFVRNPGAIAAADADPDSDGILNVLECGLGLHPRRSDPAGLPVVTTITNSGQTFPAIRFTRRTGVTALSVLPQQSFDMANWWDETSPTDEIPRLTQVSAKPMAENMEEVTVRSIYSLQQNPRQCLRVRAVLTP